jgi:hypothetical protein
MEDENFQPIKYDNNKVEFNQNVSNITGENNQLPIEPKININQDNVNKIVTLEHDMDQSQTISSDNNQSNDSSSLKENGTNNKNESKELEKNEEKMHTDTSNSKNDNENNIQTEEQTPSEITSINIDNEEASNSQFKTESINNDSSENAESLEGDKKVEQQGKEVEDHDGVDEQTEQNEENKLKTEIESSENMNTDDAVADVVAAVEQAAAARASLSPNSSINQQNKPPNTPRRKPTLTKSKSIANPSGTSINSMTLTDISATGSGTSGSKRRKKDPSAPKAPLNGYLVYFNRERTEMHQKNPQIGFGELTRIIANKWKEMNNEDKQKYISEAEQDKERYLKEMADYKKSDSYKQYLKEVSNQQNSNEFKLVNQIMGPSAQQDVSHNSNNHELSSMSNIAGFDIPIFTPEFIEHSKSREFEMRQLRKEINELEQQNGVLNKHVENLKQNTQKCDADIDAYRNVNMQLQKNLDVFRQTVMHYLSNVPLPNTQDYFPNASNIDDYIMKLLTIVNMYNQLEQQQNFNDQNYLANRNFVQHVKSVFGKINFNSVFEGF